MFLCLSTSFVHNYTISVTLYVQLTLLFVEISAESRVASQDAVQFTRRQHIPRAILHVLYKHSK